MRLLLCCLLLLLLGPSTARYGVWPVDASTSQPMVPAEAILPDLTPQGRPSNYQRPSVEDVDEAFEPEAALEEEEEDVPTLFYMHTISPPAFLQSIQDGRRLPVWPFPPLFQVYLPAAWLSKIILQALKALTLAGSIVIPKQTIRQGIFTPTTQEVTLPQIFAKLDERHEPQVSIGHEYIDVDLRNLCMIVSTFMTITAEPDDSWLPSWRSLVVSSGEMEVKVVGLQCHLKMRIDPPFTLVVEEVDWNVEDIIMRQLSQRMLVVDLLYSLGISSAWILKRRLRADPTRGDFFKIMSVPRQVKDKFGHFFKELLPAFNHNVTEAISDMLQPLFPFSEQIAYHVFPQMYILRGRLAVMAHVVHLPADGPFPFNLTKEGVFPVGAEPHKARHRPFMPEGYAPSQFRGASLAAKGLRGMQTAFLSLYRSVLVSTQFNQYDMDDHGDPISQRFYEDGRPMESSDFFQHDDDFTDAFGE